MDNSCLCMWTISNWLNIDPMWEELMKEVDLGEPTSFLDQSLWVAHNESAKRAKILWTITEMCLNPGSLQEQEKNYLVRGNLTHTSLHGAYDMERHAKKCVERYCELANKTLHQLYKVTTPCLDHHQVKEELGSVGDMSKVCSQIVLKCLYLARIGRPDIPWSANTLARAVTKWTRACGKRLARLISYIHHTNDCRQHCHVVTRHLVCCKTHSLLATLRIQNQLREESSVFLEAEHLFPSVGCVRHKRGVAFNKQHLETK